jgi:hypothetical protein
MMAYTNTQGPYRACKRAYGEYLEDGCAGNAMQCHYRHSVPTSLCTSVCLSVPPSLPPSLPPLPPSLLLSVFLSVCLSARLVRG